MADIPESTKSEHVVWTVDATSYLRNLDSEDLRSETIAVHYQKAPEKTETGTRISLCFPTLIVSGYCSEPREVADRVARILNAHWDEPAAPPAMDREAVETATIERCASIVEGFFSPNAAAEQIYAAQIAAEIRALSTLSADAIRQGEGIAQFGAEMFQVIWDQFADAGYEIEIHDLIAVSAVKAGLVRVTKFYPEVHTDNSGEAEPGDKFYEVTAAGRAALATPASHASDGGMA